jgi:GTP-binding protein Era
MTDDTVATRCGQVAILGAPNAGKSTLVNRLVGSKVSIVSPKVQTTRNRVIAIQMSGQTQLIYIDTPGIFAANRRLDRAMVAAAWTGAADADEIVLLIDSSQGRSQQALEIVDQLRVRQRRATLALNKIDTIDRPLLLELASRFDADGMFERVFMISALTGDGVADLETWLAERMPLGPLLYPEDQLADLPQRLLAAEITREQLYLQLHDELPYAAAVLPESWEERADGSVNIHQVIYVQRPGQKAIVLGKGGKQIREIGMRSRRELEAILDRRVHLFLFVKVRENWTDDREHYAALGLNFET